MIALFKQFLDRLKFEGLSPFGRFYGVWKGKVLRTVDNDNQGKIQVAVPEVSGSDTIPVANPAYPMDPLFASFPPAVGEWVWVFFEQGDPRFPVYIGHWWAKNERPSDLNPPANTAPTKRFFVTESGHQLVFEDKTGSEEILIQHKNGTSKITLKSNGDVVVDADGSKVQINSTSEVDLGTVASPTLDNLATKHSLDPAAGHFHIGNLGVATSPPVAANIPPFVTTVTKAN